MCVFPVLRCAGSVLQGVLSEARGIFPRVPSSCVEQELCFSTRGKPRSEVKDSRDLDTQGPAAESQLQLLICSGEPHVTPP